MKKLLLLCLLCLFVFASCKSKPKEVPQEEPVTEVIYKGTFLEILKEATKLVSAECPKVELYEADATNIADPGMTAEDVKGWRFVYNVPEDKTAFISYKDSVFSNVTIVDQPWFEDCIIKGVKIDLPEAIELMRKANYSDKFVDLCLRQPLYPGCNEPYYIFSCLKIGWVFVGTVSKKVTVEPFKK